MNKNKNDFLTTLLSSLENFTWRSLIKSFINIIKNFVNLIKKFNINNLLAFFKIVFLSLWDIFDDFRRKDHLWINTKKRLFFSKLKHFLILLFTSYYVISYIYDVWDRRHWLAESEHKSYDYSPFIISKKDWDDLIFDSMATIGMKYFGYDFEMLHLVDMWWHVVLYIIFLNIFYFSSFFFRSVHEVIYSRDSVAAIFIISINFCYQNNWYLGDLCLAYFFHYGAFIFWFLYLSNYLIFNYLQWRFEDEEEFLESPVNQHYKEMPDLLPLPNLNPYDGNLHTVPNVYSVDPDEEILQLVSIKKKRYQDVQKGGIHYELYNSTYWRYDVDKSFSENIRDNIKKTIFYIFQDLNLEPVLETFPEFLYRYYKEADISGNFGGSNAFQKKQGIVLYWNDRKRYLDPKNYPETYKHMYWVRSDVPLVFRWCYLFVWFYSEYKLVKPALILAGYDKKSIYVSFWKNFKRFFGLKIKDDSGFFKFSGGYVIKHRGIPRVFLKSDPAFDVKIYNKGGVLYDSILIQIYNIFYKIINDIKYFIFNFFGSFKFWISVLLFWQKGSPTRTFFRWIFIDNIWYYFLYIVRFVIRVPYRMYKVFDIGIYIVYSILKIYYFINVLYWSFLLNCLFTVKMCFRILFRLTRPKGPFTFYSASPWRRYKGEKFWKGFYLFFNRYIKKISKTYFRDSFLVWTEKKLKR